MDQTVKFNDADEWLEEIKQDRTSVERDIVRVTQRTRSSAAWVHTLSVVATAVTMVESVRDARYLVLLETPCGDVVPGDAAQSAKARERASSIIRRIEAACKDMGLQVRAGVIEPAGPSA